MADHLPSIQLLQASVDPDGETESDFRILVKNRFVKCLTIDGGIYETDDMCFGPALVTLLPPFPSGNWNEGRISRDATTGLPYFAAATEKKLPGIRPA